MVLALAALAGCDAAGPGFRGAEAVTREVAGSRFTLRFRGDLVEAVRTSPEWLPDFAVIARRAAFLAEAERAGCKTAWVEGDPAMLLLGLSCDGRKPPKRPDRRGMRVCELFEIRTRGAVYEGSLSCVPS
jgi:hypothetical protein